MGVDTFIFDDVSKECFYFDRNFNWFTFLDGVRDLQDAAANKAALTSGEVVLVCELNIEYWTQEGERDLHRVEWNKLIMRFAKERPNGLFFFVNDHQSPSSHDVVRSGYKEIFYEEENLGGKHD